jgi:hypothetical protein
MGFLPVSMRCMGHGGRSPAAVGCGRKRSAHRCEQVNARKRVQAKLKKSKAAKRELEAMIKEQAAVAPLTARPR